MPDKKEDGKIPVKRKSALPIWVCAAVWVIAGLFVPMYKVSHIAIVAVVSAAAWLIAWLVAPEYTEYIDAPRPTSGDRDADALCLQIETEVAHLQGVAGQLPPEKAASAARLTSVCTTLTKIAEDLVRDPSDLPACRRLASYYLPVIRKISDKYVFLLRQSGGLTSDGSDGELGTLTDLVSKIETAFDSIDVALKKQLDAMYKNDDLDISTDIDVLQQMLRQDGLE